MKRFKTAIIVIICITILSVVLFFLPLEGFLQRLPVIKSFYQNTTLEISAPNGKVSVKINGKEYGETPISIKNLPAGTYIVELTKISSQQSFYKTHKFNIPLTKNSVSVVSMEIGPNDHLHGVILYYEKDSTKSEEKGKITITSDTEGSDVYINNEFLKPTPVTNIKLNTGEYTISLNSKQYEDLEFPIIIREGYILYVKGYQLPIPIYFEKVDNE